MDNLQSKGESEASENDYYISPLNDQTSVLVVETIENVEPSIVISVDKRGSKLRKRKKSKRRKKRNTLEGLPSNSDNELKSLYNGRKSARRAVSLNDKDLKVNVSKYKLQTSRSLKAIKRLNLLENQKITEEKSNEDLSLKEITVNISTRKDNTEDKVRTTENTIKITKDNKKTFEDEKFQNMSTSEILNGYISDIENRIGFTLNQSTALQRSSPCLQKKRLKQGIDQVCIKSKSKRKDSEESVILPMDGVVQLQQTCKMLDYISKMQHRNRVLENKIVVLEKELVEVKQLIPKSLQSLTHISQHQLRKRTKSKSMLNLHIESQSDSVETKSNVHKLLISSKSDAEKSEIVPPRIADLKKESTVLKENKKTKHGLKNKISASIENLTKEIKSENNKKEKVTDLMKQNTSETKSNEKKMSKKAPSRLFSWGASEWRSKSVERFQPEPNKFAQIRTSSDAAEKHNKTTVEWNALQELFPTQNNQPVIRSYSQAKLPSTNPFKNRKWRLKKSNVTPSNQSQSKVFLPHDAKVSLSDMEAASNLSRQSTLQLNNSEVEQIAITSFIHQDSDDRASLSSNCTKLESLKEVFDDESSNKPNEAQQISSSVL